jgi:uncharacterized membrane protein
MDTIAALGLARAIHVAAVVWWIGGVAFVTLVLLPAIGAGAAGPDRFALFDRVERRFAGQARVATLLAGLSGVYLLYEFDAWSRFAEPSYWWLHAMVAVWAIFTLMLFVLEPLVLHRVLHRRAARDPDGTFRLVQRLHYALLAVSVLTLVGGVAGSHGWLPI